MYKKTFTFLELMIVIALIAIVIVIALPRLEESRKLANEAAAISALKNIGSAQTIFRERDIEKDGLNDFGTLAELAAAELIDPLLAKIDVSLPGFGDASARQGYHFTAFSSEDNEEYVWFALALPIIQGKTGDRSFATSQSGILAVNAEIPTNGSFGFDLETGQFTGEGGWTVVGE